MNTKEDAVEKKKNSEETPNKSSQDRRIRRTKALLLQSLMQLMETKDVRDISVKELSDLADINRGTFYLHYRDIYDMLKQVEDELFLEFNAIFHQDICRSRTTLSSQKTLLNIFSFLERHRDVARIMVGPHGDHSFVSRLKNAVKEYISDLLEDQNSAYYYAYVESFIVSGCTGVIETWLNQDSPRSPEEMSIICNDMLMKGLKML